MHRVLMKNPYEKDIYLQVFARTTVFVRAKNYFLPKRYFFIRTKHFLFGRIAIYRIVVTINCERESERERGGERERERVYYQLLSSVG